MKRILQSEKQFYSIHEGLKVAEGLFDLLKRSHDDGDSKLGFDVGNVEEQSHRAKSALQAAIKLTRPLGIPSANGKTEGKRILTGDVDLKAVGEGLKLAEAVVDVAQTRCKIGTLMIADTAIEFDDTELVFTTEEYFDFAKRALTDALQKAEGGMLIPEVSIVDKRTLDGRPAWERKLIEGALPLGDLQNPKVRNKVTRAKLVFGFDVSKEFKGLVFFGGAYFLNLAEKGGSVPADDIIAFTYHSELEGDLKLAAAVQVLKGSCDLL